MGMEDNKAIITLSFPSENIPIKDLLVNLAREPLDKLKVNIEIKIAIMNEKELQYYFFIINTLGFGLIIIPFLVLFAQKNFGLSYDLIGNFLLFPVLTGFLISTLGYLKIFIAVSIIILMGYMFVEKLRCKTELG